MADGIRFLASLQSNSTIRTLDGEITVSTTTYVNTKSPVVLRFGPLGSALSVDEARELGAALIEAAHHWQAALAEFQQHQAEQAAAAQGGEA